MSGIYKFRKGEVVSLIFTTQVALAGGLALHATGAGNACSLVIKQDDV